MGINRFKDNVRNKSTSFHAFLYNTFKGAMNIEVPIPGILAGMLFHERALRHQTWYWIKNKLYCEPLLRYRCTSVGKKLKTDGDIPLISGSGDIIIGNNVRIGNRCSWILSSNLHNHPRLVIGDNTTINYLTGISVEEKVEIGNNCVIAGETMIFDNNSHGLNFENGRKMTIDDVSPIKIEDHVWIGMRSFILKGVTVGKGSVVGACSVVTKDVPPMTMVGGNPAKILKEIYPPADILF